MNVGDIKPMEFPLQFFMDLAWIRKVSLAGAFVARLAVAEDADASPRRRRPGC